MILVVVAQLTTSIQIVHPETFHLRPNRGDLWAVAWAVGRGFLDQTTYNIFWDHETA